MSCDGHSLGCFGGNSFTAFKYIQHNKGIVNETSYPYKAKVSLLSNQAENITQAHV